MKNFVIFVIKFPLIKNYIMINIVNYVTLIVIHYLIVI